MKSCLCQIRRLARPLVLACLGAVTVGCSSAQPSDEAQDTDAQIAPACALSTCGSLTWPRLVVSLSDQRPGSDASAPSSSSKVAISAEFGGMEMLADPTEGECLNGVTSIRCSASFYGYPGLESMTLHVSVGGTRLASSTVQLKPFNHCGDDLAYVSVAIESDSEVTIGVPSYVSPCRALQ